MDAIHGGFIARIMNIEIIIYFPYFKDSTRLMIKHKVLVIMVMGWQLEPITRWIPFVIMLGFFSTFSTDYHVHGWVV